MHRHRQTYTHARRRASTRSHTHTHTYTHTHTLQVLLSATLEKGYQKPMLEVAHTHTRAYLRAMGLEKEKEKRHSACLVWNCRKVGTSKNVVSGICWNCEQDWSSWVRWAWKHTRLSKETVGNSWDILNAILGHKYHQNHANISLESGKQSYLASEANTCNKSDFDYSL